MNDRNEADPLEALRARAERGTIAGHEAVLAAARTDAGSAALPDVDTTRPHRWVVSVAALVLMAAGIGGAVVRSRTSEPAPSTPAGRTLACADLLVFLDPASSDAARRSVQAEIEAAPDVASVLVLDQDDVYERFRALFRDEPAMIENVQPDELPVTIQVEAADASGEDPLGGLRTQVQRNDGVLEVRAVPAAVRCRPEAFWNLVDAEGDEHRVATTVPAGD